MFFVIEEWCCITIKPSQLGPRYEQCVEDSLRFQVEGKCTAKTGYVICVVKLVQKLPGRIQDATGHILVDIKYQAIVFKPVKDEVLDGVVTDVNRLGFFVLCGPLKVFVSSKAMPSSFHFEEGAVLPCYTDSESTIKAQSEIRVQLQGFSHEQNNLYAVATIKANYLGLIENESGIGLD